MQISTLCYACQALSKLSKKNATNFLRDELNELLLKYSKDLKQPWSLHLQPIYLPRNFSIL